MPPTASRNTTSSTGIPPSMVIPQPPHPRVRTNTSVSNIPNYHQAADRTERSTKDPGLSIHQVRFKLNFKIYCIDTYLFG